MSTTTDPNDPRLGHGSDNEPGPQNEVYLVLSEEERAKGFVRPLRRSYVHKGRPAPVLIDLTDEQKELVGDAFAKFEPKLGLKTTGRYWTQEEIDRIDKGCGTVTSIGNAIAETYARSPGFYGSTYCVHCQRHFPVNEFVWLDDNTVVGS